METINERRILFGNDRSPSPDRTLFGGATIEGSLGGAGKLIDEREMTHLG
jgi:hypothetical protein